MFYKDGERDIGTFSNDKEIGIHAIITSEGFVKAHCY